MKIISFFTILIATSCVFSQSRVNTPIPTATIRFVQTTPVPTLQRNSHSVESTIPATETITPDCNTNGTANDADLSYHVEAQMDYAARRVEVAQNIFYTNITDDSLQSVVINVRPNTVHGVFVLNEVWMGSNEIITDFNLSGARLVVNLPAPLEVGCTLHLTLDFTIFIPPMDIGGTKAYQGYLGYSSRQINLGHWLPAIALWRNNEWVSHEPSNIGEQEVLIEAEWDIYLTIDNAPPTLKIAAPGSLEADSSERTQHYRLEQGRDFSLSMSDQYNVNTQTTANGIRVELYSFDDAIIQTDSGDINSAAFALDVGSKSVAMYSDLFGAYPNERLVIVQADFPDGMEFSGLVFVGGEYFRGFGGPNSYLMLITVHEIAHQWWYNKVGNDAALNPWLDEALSTYSEIAFIEEYYPALKDWWWEFRVNQLSPEGFVDSPVYEFSSRRAYINAVYLRGVRMLDELRNLLGTDTFYDWLKRYAEMGSGQVMQPQDLWLLLSPAQFGLTESIRNRYLRSPQIITISSTESNE